MARVTKCDRCGKIFEHGANHTAHVFVFVGSLDMMFDASPVDLCDECYDGVLEFLKPIQRTEDMGNGVRCFPGGSV